jgi:hypothetical protein
MFSQHLAPPRQQWMREKGDDTDHFLTISCYEDFLVQSQYLHVHVHLEVLRMMT